MLSWLFSARRYYGVMGLDINVFFVFVFVFPSPVFETVT